MLESLQDNKFEYQKLSLEEQKARGILGRLAGVIADTKNPTRNGRLYTEDLWDKVFSNPIMKEKIENRCVFGELCHPVDRVETDMEKIAICLAEVPKKGKDGKLYGVFDILDTPNGRILKTLCDYGCNIGVSSRGQGDVLSDYDGNDRVDPDTYECECWDAVLTPSVKDARPKIVTESLHNKISLAESLSNLIKSSNDNDRKIMSESLDKLNISLGRTLGKDISNKKVVAENNGTDKLLENLTEQLRTNKELNGTISTLQEKLSVSNAKEVALREKVKNLSNSITKMSNTNTELKAKNNKLIAQVSMLSEKLSIKDKDISNVDATIAELKESISTSNSNNDILLEENKNQKRDLRSLTHKCESLTEQLRKEKESHSNEIKELKEQLLESRQDLQIKNTEYQVKIDNLTEQLRKANKVAKASIDRYIESKSAMIGVKPQDIKNKLPESYTFSDIDRICEELKSYNLNMSKLPFTLGDNVKIKTNFAEAKIKNSPVNKNIDDIVDEDLLSLVEKITNK